MKRSLSLVLVLALILGMFSAFALFAGAEEGAGETPAPTEPETPAPTEPETPAAPVEIATAGDFAAMAADGNYILTADITVAATYKTKFTGTFDGNGKTITTSVVLFDTLEGATIKNLTIAGEINAVKDSRAASLAREASKFTVENVTNKANITAGFKGGYVGGLIAQGITGGGTAEKHEKSYFTDCVNNGNITYLYEDSKKQDTPRVAGIIGNVAKYQHGVYTNCVNNGKISVTGAGLKGAPYVAGIAGSSFGGDFANCVNNGDLYCDAGAHMGGILGRGTPSSQNTDQSSTAVGCVNNGNLTIATAPSITSGTVGGIFGHCGATMKDNARAVYTVEKCVNTGTLACSGTQAGGIIGYVWGSDSNTRWSYGVVRNCVNLGKLVGTKNAAPATEPDTTFFRATYLSHFIGYVNATKTVMENCYGLGTLENTNDNYNALFGLSSFVALEYKIKNIVLAPNDGTKHFSYGHDAMVDGKLENRSHNRITLEAYKAMEGKAGNVVNDKNVYVVDGTEGKTLADAIAAVADGEYIVLLADVALPAEALVEKADMTFTLDGMGHTITGNVTLNTPGCTVNVKDLKVVGALTTALNAADKRATLNAMNVEIDASAAASNALTNAGYWDFNLEGCKLTGKKTAFNCTLDSEADAAKVTMKNCEMNGLGSYGVYYRAGYTIEMTDTVINSKGNSGIQIKTAATNRATMTLVNCTLTAVKGYGVNLNGNKLYIQGGTYVASDKDACINVNGDNAYCEIRGGSFTCNQNCAARAYGAGTVMDIYDGEFYYTGTAGGSAIRGGTKDKGGTINIHGGVFSSTGTQYAVINGVHADSVITINAGKFINAGTAVIPVYTKTGSAGTDTINFPEGQKEFVLEAPVPPVTDNTTTENKPGDNTTENKPGDNTTTESKPTDSKPADTTGAAGEGGCGGCGGFAAAAQVVALIVGVVGVALVVKRK